MDAFLCAVRFAAGSMRLHIPTSTPTLPRRLRSHPATMSALRVSWTIWAPPRVDRRRSRPSSTASQDNGRSPPNTRQRSAGRPVSQPRPPEGRLTSNLSGDYWAAGLLVLVHQLPESEYVKVMQGLVSLQEAKDRAGTYMRTQSQRKRLRQQQPQAAQAAAARRRGGA